MSADARLNVAGELFVHTSDENWFEDESFWTATFPFMFPEARFLAAADEVSKIMMLAKVSTGKVLDLACGPGRYAIPFAQAGFAVTAVDRTRFLINKARERATDACTDVELVQQDMRQFRRPGEYDLAINLFTSFGYFEKAADNRIVLENIFGSLKPGGVFVFDHLGKEVLAAIYQPTRSETLPDGTLLVQRASVIDDWSRVAGEWIVISGERTVTFHNCHWIYSGREIRELLTNVGFEEILLYGSLDAAPYDHQAQRLVAVARKPRQG